MDIINLRDLKGEDLKKWKKAIKDQTSYNFDDLKENEPTMIADYDFKEYAQELADGYRGYSRDCEWPVYCIDWEWAARELKMDYDSLSLIRALVAKLQGLK